MPNIERVSIIDFVKSSMIAFAQEVNTNRQLNFLYDGLKPIYRRVFVTALKFKEGKFEKTAKIVGDCMGNLHPHGDSSIAPVVSNMVRYGIFDGQGGHGSKELLDEDERPAAMRYSEAMLSQKFRDLVGPLIDYVPWKEGELEGNTEPEYIPMPVPLCLAFGSLGIGIGVNCRIPAFTVKSMYEALVNDDPRLLKVPFGLKLIENECDLQQLWDTGLGKLTYAFETEWKGKGCYLKGEAELFRPNLAELIKLRDDGKLSIDDAGDGEGSKLYIQRNSGIRSVTDDDIWNLVQEAAKKTRYYRLTITDGKNCYLIPLKEWIKETYENYLRIVESYKQSNIDRLNFSYQVYDWLSTIANEIINVNPDITNEELSQKFDLDIEVVKAIVAKPISTLRKADTSSQKKRIKKQIKEFEAIDPIQWTKDIIDEF